VSCGQLVEALRRLREPARQGWWLGPILVAIAWSWMVVEAMRGHRFACCGSWPGWPEEAAGWLAMVCAMMLPTTLGSQRDVARRSYRVRRTRAVAAYIAGYLLVWASLGIAVVAVRQLPATHLPLVAPSLCIAHAIWVLLPVRQRWFTACHRQIPLHPVGGRADVDAAHQGLAHGTPCAAMCWPLMIACTATGHAAGMMVGGAALVVVEKRMFRLRRSPLVVGSLALAAVSTV
jgi:predicted metal-binding membrane protein